MSSIGPVDRKVDAIRGAAPRAAILLDFDGTLSPIVGRPELARIEHGMREVLGELVSAFELVAVVTGRPSSAVEPLIEVDGIRVEGLYGLAARASEVPDVVAEGVARVGATLPGSFVEPKGATIALHVRGTRDPDAAGAQALRALAPLAEAADMRIIGGKRVLELVPRDAPLKDAAVRRLLSSVEVDAAMYAGDDAADLDAFAALDAATATGVKVAVRGPETPAAVLDAADVVVEGPRGMRDLLRAVIPERG
jgi:trehalose 6-phosphate phosphatase